MEQDISFINNIGVVLRGNPFLLGIYRRTSCHVAYAPRNDDYKIYSVGDSKNAADEFSEEGHSADGGLRNGDLLTLKSAKATILPTASCDPENLSPRGFGSTFSVAKGGRKKF